MDVKISELADVSELTSDSVSPTSQSGTTKKFSMSQLANYVINIFSGLSLAGVTQTVKSAIDAIHNKIGTTSMGTEATTVTGAIAEHGDTLSGVADNISTLFARQDPFAITSTEISENTDVDTLDTPGNYYCFSGTVAGTLTHAPFTNSSFQMLVFGYVGQQRFVVAWQNAVRTRVVYRSRTDTGEWGIWYSVTRDYDFSPMGSWNSTSGSLGSRSALTTYVDGLYTSFTQGVRFGYIQAADATSAGLPSVGGYYFMSLSNSANYRILMAVPTSGTTIHTLIKSAGTWATSWRQI